MKKQHTKKYFVLFLSLLLIFNFETFAQDKVVPKEIVNLHYFNNNNNFQYLMLESLLKTGKKIEPQSNKVFQLYLDTNSPENLITKVLTDVHGKAKAVIPVQLKTIWDAAAEHTFIAVAEGSSKEEETSSEFTFTKAKMTLDTTNEDGIKSITATVTKLEDDAWVPVEGVEMKIGVKRMDNSILSAGEEATYTTDTSGSVTVELNKINLPGNVQGNLVIAALVEDNDQIGSFLIEKAVPWGIPLVVDNTFFKQRTLWATRFHSPYWLLAIAYSIGLGVWGVIIYLIVQIFKIKKLGVSHP